MNRLSKELRRVAESLCGGTRVDSIRLAGRRKPLPNGFRIVDADYVYVVFYNNKHIGEANTYDEAVEIVEKYGERFDPTGFDSINELGKAMIDAYYKGQVFDEEVIEAAKREVERMLASEKRGFESICRTVMGS